VVGVGWLLARLPLSVINALGSRLGALAYRLAPTRRHISDVNLQRCFPELEADARRALNKQVFRHAGIGMLELMLTWLNPQRNLVDRVQVNGAKHLIEARSLGRGVLLVAGHFTALDIFSQAIAAIADTDVMYRENKNAAWEWLQLQGRKHYFKAVIERSDIRETLRRLKAGDIVWYAPDQDYGAKHSVFAPFFGIQAASITATPRIARFNNSPVVFMTHYRNESNIGWTMTFYPMLEDFPSGNDVSDATRINALVEDAVRRHPAQYLWMHRRFKTRPPGEARFY
jgi:KDO2-lipid IV(A) lauroyltransferase